MAALGSSEVQARAEDGGKMTSPENSHRETENSTGKSSRSATPVRVKSPLHNLRKELVIRKYKKTSKPKSGSKNTKLKLFTYTF